MSELDPAIIKRTQETLGKFVKKPPLTEKLLKKPPFRFLHDVFNAVIKDTGCFKGLYTAEELDFENIKDRDDKMRFLQKMIDVIKIVGNVPITVRTSKIVAGQEPEKTNELLQLMGEVIEKMLDWQSAVEKVRTGKEGKPTEKEKSNSKINKTNEKAKPKDKEPRTIKDAKVNGVKSTKTISPTSKTEQQKKVTETNQRNKEKVSKASKEKVSKETKEKTTKKTKEPVEKSNSTKEKERVKAKSTPSPVSEDTRSVEPPIVKATEALINAKADSIEKSEPPELMHEGGVVEPAMNGEKVERRNSKIMNESILQSPTETPPPKYETVVEPKDSGEPEIRKSSAQQRRSSGKSRRSSATKERTNKDDASTSPQTLSNNFESLNAVKEEKEPSAPETKTKQPPMPAVPTEAMSNGSPHNSIDVKRESTFTRENSKDSSMLARENSRESSTSNVANRPRTSLRPPSARPASARPGAPRRRDKNVEIVLQPNDQIKMSGISVKLESFGDLDDDGENLVIIEDSSAVPLSNENTETRDSSAAQLEQQGHLVQQILETQKELMQNGGGGGKQEKDDINSGLNARQSSARQMNNLRDFIQNLTKAVNPFGKLMDFIPEDIDAMQLELTMWRDTYTQAANELRREKSLTESAIEPMKNQLVQIEASIKEYLEMVDASRAKILQNSEKILKMLTEQ